MGRQLEDISVKPFAMPSIEISVIFIFKPQEVNNINKLTHKHNKALKFTLINQPTFYIYNDG